MRRFRSASVRPSLCILSILLLLATLTRLSHSQPTSLRGIRKSDVSKYSGATFTCLDGSASIPSRQVNDDYCDCADGSDEPGTSACPNSSFFCANRGASSLTLHSSRVNDLICDCCDGSDEWAAKGATACTNRCAEEGREKHKHVLDEIAATEAGVKSRQLLVEEAKQLQSEKEAQRAKYAALIDERQKVLDDAKAALAELEKVEQAEKDRLKAVEDAEAAEAARLQAEQQQQQPSASEQADPEFLKLAQQAEQDSTPLPADQQLEAQAPLGNTETPDAAKPDAQPAENFPYPAEYMYKPSDEAAAHHSTAAAAEPVIQQEIENFPYPAEYAYHADAAHTTAQTEQPAAGELVEEDDEPPAGVVAGVVPSGEAPAAAADGQAAEPAKVTSASYTLEAASQACDVVRAAQEKLDRVQNKLNTVASWLNADYGPDLAFASLANHCFTYAHNQYTYEMCPYVNAHQKEGGSSTSLGTWDGLKQRAEGNETVHLLTFANGQGCWQGPSRSLAVVMRCGVENVIRGVEEPSKCVYEMAFYTPLVCDMDKARRMQRELEEQMAEAAAEE